MPSIEVTAGIRRSRAEIYEYLHELSNYREFLPDTDFREFVAGDAVGGRNAAELKWHVLGRWWFAGLELDSDEPTQRIVLKSRGCSLPFRWTWTLGEMKKDRKGEKAEVHLRVDVDLPGGAVGKALGGALVERQMLRAFDGVLRNLEGALGATPRSGLRPAKEA